MICLFRHGGEETEVKLHIRNPTLGGGWSAPRSGRFTSRKETVFIVQKAGWALGPVWTARKVSPSPGFYLRTAQPIASRYTDCTILASSNNSVQFNSSLLTCPVNSQMANYRNSTTYKHK